MIVFDLVCGGAGHVFEAWFGSTGDYEAQKARGLVACPLCGSGDVDKAPMSPRLGTRGNRLPEPARPAQAVAPAPAPAPAAAVMPAGAGAAMTNGKAAAIKAMLQAMAKAQAKALQTSDYVGSRFADEARAIHLGEVEERSIHGRATVEEARALIEEGIEVAPLPFPVRSPASEN